MNTLLATASYVGEKFMDNGLRFMQMNLPKVGNSGAITPVFVVPNKAAGETFDVFQPGVNLLISGRLYPNRQDYKMYLVPNQVIQVAPPTLVVNQVNLAGGVGFIPDQTKEDLFTFSLMCSAPAQQILGHTWDDSLSFRMEAWGDDAKRMATNLHVGRQIAVTGALRYNTWTTQDGQQRGIYQVRVKSGTYAFFGKNKKKEEQSEVKTVVTGDKFGAPQAVVVEPYQSSVVLPPVNNQVPMSVNTDEVPF
jgi:single-stranded DNA-binding protein